MTNTALFRLLSGALSLNLVLLGSIANAGFTAFETPRNHYGSCMLPLTEKASIVLKRNGVRVIGVADSSDKEALARGIALIEKLNGGVIPADWHIGYNYINSGGPWNEGLTSHPGDLAGYINVHKVAYGGDNIGALMHEFGHKIANSRGFFSKYVAAVPKCGISAYAKTQRAEEFAEVFSTFMTDVDKLESKCPKAYKFFAHVVFKNGSAASNSSCEARNEERKTKSSVARLHNSNDDAEAAD